MDYKKLCKQMETELAMQRKMKEIERALTGKAINMTDVSPRKPSILLFSFSIEIKELIKFAETNRKNWDRILGIDPNSKEAYGSGKKKSENHTGSKKKKSIKEIVNRNRSSSSNSPNLRLFNNFGIRENQTKDESNLGTRFRSNSRDPKRSFVKFNKIVAFGENETKTLKTLTGIPEVRARSHSRR